MSENTARRSIRSWFYSDSCRLKDLVYLPENRRNTHTHTTPAFHLSAPAGRYTWFTGISQKKWNVTVVTIWRWPGMVGIVMVTAEQTSGQCQPRRPSWTSKTQTFFANADFSKLHTTAPALKVTISHARRLFSGSCIVHCFTSSCGQIRQAFISSISRCASVGFNKEKSS